MSNAVTTINGDGQANFHVGNIYHTPQTDSRSTRRIEILKTLHTSPYRDRKERNPDRVPGTCEWFETHELFREWRESKTSCMLWVSADPGCGKSVLAKHLVNTILPTTESRTTCYFFFKDDFEDQRSAKNALCCILHQLFEQRESLLSNRIMEQFETSKEHLMGSIRELWEILVIASRARDAGEIVCILDAFDECGDQERSELTQAICKFYSTTNDSNLKFILTSRPYGNIRRGFQPITVPGLPVIHLSGEKESEISKIAREIDIFIKARIQIIQETLKLDPNEGSLLLESLLNIPHRTYLWAYLTLNLVQGDPNIGSTGILKATSHLPQTVDEAYEKILSKSSDLKAAKRLLHIIVAANRPFTLSEMALALAIQEDHRSYKDIHVKSEDRFREYVRDLCGLFVTIIGSKIYLLHQTAKEFLVQEEESVPVQQRNSNHHMSPATKKWLLGKPAAEVIQSKPRCKSAWKSSLSTRESHRVLSQICIWYLLCNEFRTNSLYEKDNGDLSHYLDDHIFLDYAARTWTLHFRMAGIENDVSTGQLLELCDTHSASCTTWFKVYWQSTYGEYPRGFTSLMIASYFGLVQVVGLLLKTHNASLNAYDETHQHSALSWASENGFDDVARMLIRRAGISYQDILRLSLSNRAVIDAKDIYDRTPLSYAARKGHATVFKRLVKAGARVDSIDKSGGMPVSYGLCNGLEDVVCVHLKTMLHDVPSVDELIKPILFFAAQSGDEKTVEMILDSDKIVADPDEPTNGRTPFSVAAENGRYAVVKILLESGKVDADMKDFNGRSPFSYAAANGHGRIMKLLLESSKIEIDSKDLHGRTPFSFATESGHQSVVKMLLESGKVDPDMKDFNGRTPFSYAAADGRNGIMKLLLERSKVEIDSRDNNGRTPLSFAAESGHQYAVKMLLESDKVDAESKDVGGRTPFLFAAKNNREVILRSDNREAILRLFIGSSKIKLMLGDKDDETLFFWAARNDRVNIINLLHENGRAGIDSKNRKGRTPLSVAAEYGHLGVVKLLLRTYDVDVDSKDADGRTPFSWAAGEGRLDVVRLLCGHIRVDIEARDHCGLTPLSWAVINRHLEVISMLIETDRVNIHLDHTKGRSPFFWAHRTGDVAVVHLFRRRKTASLRALYGT